MTLPRRTTSQISSYLVYWSKDTFIAPPLLIVPIRELYQQIALSIPTISSPRTTRFESYATSLSPVSQNSALCHHQVWHRSRARSQYAQLISPRRTEHFAPLRFTERLSLLSLSATFLVPLLAVPQHCVQLASRPFLHRFAWVIYCWRALIRRYVRITNTSCFICASSRQKASHPPGLRPQCCTCLGQYCNHSILARPHSQSQVLSFDIASHRPSAKSSAAPSSSSVQLQQILQQRFCYSTPIFDRTYKPSIAWERHCPSSHS
jgi:hypothetical protein